MKQLIPQESITSKIFFIRGQKVMIDKNLAQLYDVSTSELNKAVKRNSYRFPEDFMFQLNDVEYRALIFQIGISKKSRGGRRFMPYAFTEQGVAMLSGILRSKKAILVNIAIMRAFVKLRQVLAMNKELAAKLEELERRVGGHDTKIQAIFEAIKRLAAPAEPASGRHKIGFRTDKS